MYIIVITNCTTNKLGLRQITACMTQPRLLTNKT
jgi:hypothetical protein